MQVLKTWYDLWIWLKNALKALGQMLVGFSVASIGGILGVYLASQTTYWILILPLFPVLWGLDQIIKAFPALTKRFTNAPGTARMGKIKDLREAGLIKGGQRNRDIYCGMFKGEPVYYSGDRHIITAGPSRSGKDTGLLVPNLRNLFRSVVVIDPKAELAAITAKHRSKFSDVIVINPFGVLTRTHPHLRSSGFNPLAVPNFTTEDRNFFAHAMGLGEAIIKLEGNDPHWCRSARSLVSSLIMRSKWFEREGKGRSTIGQVNAMLTAPFKGEKQVTLQQIVSEIGAHHYEPMAQLARRFLHDSEEVRSVISTALGQASFLSDDALVSDMDKHPKIDGKIFDFEMLKHKIITVYIILPDDMLTTHAVWLRLIVASALNALKRSGPGSIRPVLMLNEVGNLGHLEPLESGMGMAAGKGITIWSAWQSLAQITRIYDVHGFEAFMSGAGVLNSFGAGDMETARYLSSRVGNHTEIVASYSLNKDAKQVDKRDAPTGFPLRHPENIIALKGRKLLSWIEPSSVPFELDAPGYWDIPGMKGLDPNPYYIEPPASLRWSYGKTA